MEWRFIKGFLLVLLSVRPECKRFCIHKPNFNGVMLEHIIFVSRGASNDTALTMRAMTWGEILPCECGDFSPVPSNGLSLTKVSQVKIHKRDLT